MPDDFEIRLAGEIGSERQLSEAVEAARESIARALTEFERDEQPYSITLEGAGRGVGCETSLVGLSEALFRTLIDMSRSQLEPQAGVRVLAELSARWSRSAGEPGVTLRIHRAAESLADPAGMLLVDESRAFPSSDDGSGAWMAAIRDSLASNVLARADAEYALGVDVLATRSDLEGPSGLKNGLALARSIAAWLPAEIPGRPKLRELRVRIGPVARDESRARIRIWRLGFMKVPSRSRFA